MQIKALTNGMAAVVYTSGLFKVWSAVSGSCIAEYDLIKDSFIENNERPQEKIV